MIVGLAYDYCVGATALDAATHGIKTYVVMDATKSVSADTAEPMKKKLDAAGVIEITFD